MASCGETVKEPLEEAASNLSLDSLRDHKKRTLLLEFLKSEMHLSRGICLTTNSFRKIDDVSASSSIYRRYYLQRLYESFIVVLHYVLIKDQINFLK